MPLPDRNRSLPQGQARNQGPTEPDRFSDGDEWEYEYDEDETEDFYFTLDLTTHVPDALGDKRKVASSDRPSKAVLDLRLKQYKQTIPHASPARVNLNSTPEPPTGIEAYDGEEVLELAEQNSQQNDDLQQNVQTVANATPTVPQPPPVASTMQLIGLHTPTPYLIFDNKFYTTYWLTDLGTQIWVSRLGVTDSPVWSGHVLDVVGSSQVRLLAKPAKLQVRYDNADEAGQVTQAHTVADLSRNTLATESRNLSDADRPAQQLVIPRSSATDPALQAHASFMERLSALKIKKGEHDQMPLNSVRAYEYPSNAAEIRAQSWAAIEQSQAKAPPSRTSEPPPPIERDPRSERAVDLTQAIGSTAVMTTTQVDLANEPDDDAVGVSEPGNAGDAATSDTFHRSESITKETRGRTKRSAKLAGLGLSSQAVSNESPAPKRTRRTKAEMAEYRAALEAGRTMKR